MLRIADVPVISLDLETGGLIPGRHTPLAIGAVVLPGGGNLPRDDESYEITDKNSFYIQLEWDTMVVDPQALRINKLNIANPPGTDGGMTDRSMPAFNGINLFYEWLSQHYTTSVHALGLNVGSFDLPMLKSILNCGPPTGVPFHRTWPFHYRSIDLNSLFFALSQIQNKPFDAIKKEITDIAWDKLQRRHTILTDSLGVPLAHHALADAWSNVYSWEECLKRFGGDCDVLC